jgi:hypothetical protein
VAVWCWLGVPLGSWLRLGLGVSAKSVETRLSLAISARKRRRDEGAVGLGAEAARDEGAAPRTAASAGQHLSWLGCQTAMAREEFAVPDTTDPRVDAYIRTPA